MRSVPVARGAFLLTALLALVAVAMQLPLAAGDEDGYFSTPLNRALNVFAYFTVQSNLLVALSSLLLARDPGRSTPLRRWLRLTALLGITVTAVVYHLTLSQLQDLSGAALVSDQLLHTVVPALAVLGWVLLGPRDRTSWRLVGLSLVFPLLWLALTLVRGTVTGWWPYPFVDVPELGWQRVLVSCAVVGAGYLVLAAVAHGVDRLLTRRSTATEPAAQVG